MAAVEDTKEPEVETTEATKLPPLAPLDFDPQELVGEKVLAVAVMIFAENSQKLHCGAFPWDVHSITQMPFVFVRWIE